MLVVSEHRAAGCICSLDLQHTEYLRLKALSSISTLGLAGPLQETVLGDRMGSQAAKWEPCDAMYVITEKRHWQLRVLAWLSKVPCGSFSADSQASYQH